MRHSSGIIKTSKTCRLYDVIKVAEKFDFTAPPRFKVSSKYDLFLLLYRLHRLQFIQQLLRRDYASPNIFFPVAVYLWWKDNRKNASRW